MTVSLNESRIFRIRAVSSGQPGRRREFEAVASRHCHFVCNRQEIPNQQLRGPQGLVDTCEEEPVLLSVSTGEVGFRACVHGSWHSDNVPHGISRSRCSTPKTNVRRLWPSSKSEDGDQSCT